MEHKEYRKLIEHRRSWYKTVKKVYCPCLKTDVIFNSKGFYHVRYDGSGKERPINEQVDRLNLLPLSVGIIVQAEKVHRHRITKGLDYWSLQEMIGSEEAEIRVVIRKTKPGQVIFYSIFKDNGKKTVNE